MTSCLLRRAAPTEVDLEVLGPGGNFTGAATVYVVGVVVANPQSEEVEVAAEAEADTSFHNS